MAVDKNMTIRELIIAHPEAAEVLFEMGMHCVGCAMASGETIEEAAIVHGMNPDELMKKIEAVISKDNNE